MEGEKVTNFPVALLISPRYLVLINASMWAFVCACAQVLCVRVSLCAGASWGGLCGFPLFMWQWGVGNGVVVWQTDSFINNVELVFPQRLGSSHSSTWGSWSFGEHLREERIGEPRWGTGGTVTSAISPATLPRERDWRWERKRSTGKGEGGSCRQEDLNTGSIVLCGSLGEDQAEREKRAKIDSCSEVGRWESRWQKRKKEAVREMGGRGRVKKSDGVKIKGQDKNRGGPLCVSPYLCAEEDVILDRVAHIHLDDTCFSHRGNIPSTPPLCSIASRGIAALNNKCSKSVHGGDSLRRNICDLPHRERETHTDTSSTHLIFPSCGSSCGGSSDSSLESSSSK